jgi:acyl-CoA thioesterase
VNKGSESKLPFQAPPIWNLLGIEVVETRDGYAKLIMPFSEKLTQAYGIVHGGAVFTLADSAVAVSVASLVKPNRKFVTVEMKINFLEPIREGIIEATAVVLRKGRIMPAEVDIINNQELVAKAIATYIILDENKRF